MPPPKPKIWRKLIRHDARKAFERRLERAAFAYKKKVKREQIKFDLERELERKKVLDRIAKADNQRKITNQQKFLARQKAKSHSQST